MTLRPPSRSSFSDRRVLHALIVFAAAWALYAGTLGHGFTNWDDPETVLENPYIRDARHLGAILTPGETGASGIPGVYRPVWTLSYALDHSLWGLRPAGYHAHSVLLHSVNSVLVYVLALAVGLGSLGALVAAFLFAAHPVHVEAVAWVSGRNELLLTLFFLAAFLLARFRARLTGPVRAGSYGLSIALVALALLSKATATVFAFVLLGAYAWFPTKEEKGGCSTACALRNLPYLALGLLVAAVELFVSRAHVVVHPEAEGSRAATLLTIPKLILTYLGSLVWPVGLAPRYDTRFIEGFSGEALGTFLGLALVIAASIALGRRVREFGFSAWWFAWTLLPASNLVMLSSFRADRFLYLPSVGFCLAGGILFARAWRAPERFRGAGKAVGLLVLALLLFHAGTTVAQNRTWRSSVALWEETVRRSPGDYMAHHNLGIAYSEAGRAAEALSSLERSVALNPDWAKSQGNLGQVLARAGRTREAEEHLRRAVDLDPTYAPPYAALGILCAQARRFPEAVDVLIRAIRLDPDRAPAHLNLGQVYSQMGRTEDARREIRKALDLGLPAEHRERAEALLRSLEARI